MLMTMGGILTGDGIILGDGTAGMDQTGVGALAGTTGMALIGVGVGTIGMETGGGNQAVIGGIITILMFNIVTTNREEELVIPTMELLELILQTIPLILEELIIQILELMKQVVV